MMMMIMTAVMMIIILTLIGLKRIYSVSLFAKYRDIL